MKVFHKMSEKKEIFTYSPERLERSDLEVLFNPADWCDVICSSEPQPIYSTSDIWKHYDLHSIKDDLNFSTDSDLEMIFKPKKWCDVICKSCDNQALTSVEDIWKHHDEHFNDINMFEAESESAKAIESELLSDEVTREKVERKNCTKIFLHRTMKT